MTLGGSLHSLMMSGIPIHSLHSLLQSRAWNPIVAGVIIGLLQLPLSGLLGRFIGTSMSYMTLLAQVCGGNKELEDNKSNWWQVFLVGGSVLGSFLASWLEGSLHLQQVSSFVSKSVIPSLSTKPLSDGSVRGVSPLAAVIGGILLLIGAKTMRACTSGHGLSGMALMAIPSIVATCSIFAGGILTGVVLNRFLY